MEVEVAAQEWDRNTVENLDAILKLRGYKKLNGQQQPKKSKLVCVCVCVLYMLFVDIIFCGSVKL